MKKIKNIVTIIAMLVITIFVPIFAQHRSKGFYGNKRENMYNYKTDEHRGELFEKRIKNLKEKGLITEQEEKELLDKINEVKNYRKEVWADDKLTEEELKQLRNKEKELRRKVHEVLERTKEQFIEQKTIQEREKFFNERIDKMVENKKITQQQADELKKQHKELLLLEEKIWSDGVMTREEQNNLLKQKRNFNTKMREVLRKEFKNRERIKSGSLEEVPPPPEKLHFEHEKKEFENRKKIRSNFEEELPPPPPGMPDFEYKRGE